MPNPDLTFNLEEEKVNQYLMDFMDHVIHEWELNCNSDELIRGIHSLQMFIFKHMIQRLEGEDFSKWYGKDDA